MIHIIHISDSITVISQGKNIITIIKKKKNGCVENTQSHGLYDK